VAGRSHKTVKRIFFGRKRDAFVVNRISSSVERNASLNAAQFKEEKREQFGAQNAHLQ